MEWDEYGNPVPPTRQQAPFALSEEWDESGNAVPPGGVANHPPPAHGPPAGYTDFHGGVNTFLSGATLGASDELGGFTGGVVGAADALANGEDPGQAYIDQYRAYTDQSREFQNEFTRRQPWLSPLVRGTGGALPAVATLGRLGPAQAGEALAPQAAARGGVGGLAQRSAQAGSVGSIYGYGAGFASADGDLSERMLAGNEGGGTGAVVGGLLPPALATANQFNRSIGRPAWEMATDAMRRLPVANPNAIGAMGGNIRPSRTPPPPREPRFDPATGTAIERLANRSRQTPAQIRSRLGEYRLNPQGQVLVDVFDQPGVQTLRSMTQSPGQTGQRAAEVARQRFTEAPERILTELNRRMAVAETPEQAMASLRSQYERVSAENYRPIFERRISQGQRDGLERVLSDYRTDPVYISARGTAERIFARDRANGTVTGELDDNFPRFAHYVKMGLDDAVSGAPVGSRGLQATEMRGVYAMRQRILRAIDENVPGYAQARAEWGGLVEAEEALAQGSTMLNMGSRAVREQMTAMSPFARYHARVGFANAVATRIGLRGSVNGNRNVAEVLGSPEMQARVRAMFDDPAEAAAFLDTLNQQNMLMRNAQQWSGGSSTASNLSHADDNTALETGIDFASGRRVSAVNRIRNTVSGGMQERTNNRVGEALLQRVDTDSGFASAVVRELQRREAERLAQAQAGRAGAAGSGSQQGDRR